MLPDKIKQLILDQRLSTELAKHLDLSRAHFSNCMRGEKKGNHVKGFSEAQKAMIWNYLYAYFTKSLDIVKESKNEMI